MTATVTWTQDSVVYPKLLDLCDCLCQQITASNLPEPCFCGVLPGVQVALDEIDQCALQSGMAWVRLAGMAPQAGIGIANINPIICPTPMNFTVEVGIIRCSPTMDEQGTPPDVAEWTDAVDLQMADRQAMVRAMVCCLGTKGWTMDSYIPIGPTGGVVGGFWLATASADG
jgi:hypothetical protein